MHPKFQALIEDLHIKFESLMKMNPVMIDTIPDDSPKGGVYLFSYGGENLYVGRTKRKIKDRLKDHVSSADDCPFAWRIAREVTGNKTATYKFQGSREDLLNQSNFRAEYEKAKKEIRKMEIRYVGEADPQKQALLEIYVAIAAGAKHNYFDTH